MHQPVHYHGFLAQVSELFRSVFTLDRLGLQDFRGVFNLLLHFPEDLRKQTVLLGGGPLIEQVKDVVTHLRDRIVHDGVFANVLNRPDVHVIDLLVYPHRVADCLRLLALLLRQSNVLDFLGS